MTIKVGNISRWAKLPLGKTLVLDSDKLRTVRLDLNCPAPTRLDAVQGANDETTFLAVVTGVETVQFDVFGKVEVVFTRDDDIWYWTDDGDSLAFENSDAVTFTKIATRRTRNPELELMMFKAEERMNRRLAQQEEELARLRGELAIVDRTTGEVIENDQVGDGHISGSDGTPSGGASDQAEPPVPGTDPGAGAGTGVSTGSAATK